MVQYYILLTTIYNNILQLSTVGQQINCIVDTVSKYTLVKLYVIRLYSYIYIDGTKSSRLHIVLLLCDMCTNENNPIDHS